MGTTVNNVGISERGPDSSCHVGAKMKDMLDRKDQIYDMRWTRSRTVVETAPTAKSSDGGTCENAH